MPSLAKAARVSTLAVMPLLFVFCGRPAIALDTYGVTPDKKLAKALSDLADTCFECGDKAKEKGLFTSARSFFSHALEYDTDHRPTRKAMGFKKKGNTWVSDENTVPLDDKVPAAKLVETEIRLYTDTRAIRTKAAEALYKFVADKNLAADQRLLALYHALVICPEHQPSLNAARAVLGPHWNKHYLDEAHELKREERLKAAPEPEAITEATPYETACGHPFVKRRTPWFVTHFDLGAVSEAWAPVMTRLCEASRSHALELMGTPSASAPKDDANRYHFTVFATRERFATFVEKCSGLPDASHRAEVSKGSLGSAVYKPYGSVWLYDNAEIDYGLRDGISHDAAYKEVSRCTDEGGYWLAQGMGYLNSAHMVGSTSSRFFGVKASGVIDTRGKEALPGLGDNPAGWRLQVALSLAGGKSPGPSQLATLRVNDFTNQHMALAFCLADYLTSQHQEKMKAFFESALKERIARFKDKKASETPQECLKRLFENLGMDEAALLGAFKTWALANYVRLPAE